MTVLVCSAHADDEVIGVGGTIAKFAKKEKVIVIIFSYGSGKAGRMSSWPLNMSEEKLTETRVKESQAAGKILGVYKTFFLGIKEFISEEFTSSHKKTIMDIIKKYKPNKIFYHSLKDKHPDHLSVNKIMNDIINSLKKKPEVLTYQINTWDFSTKDPEIIIDVSEEYKKKLKALDCFKSQRIWTIPLKPIILLKGIYFGKKAGVKFAEYFYDI